MKVGDGAHCSSDVALAANNVWGLFFVFYVQFQSGGYHFENQCQNQRAHNGDSQKVVTLTRKKLTWFNKIDWWTLTKKFI